MDPTTAHAARAAVRGFGEAFTSGRPWLIPVADWSGSICTPPTERRWPCGLHRRATTTEPSSKEAKLVVGVPITGEGGHCRPKGR